MFTRDIQNSVEGWLGVVHITDHNESFGEVMVMVDQASATIDANILALRKTKLVELI